VLGDDDEILPTWLPLLNKAPTEVWHLCAHRDWTPGRPTLLRVIERGPRDVLERIETFVMVHHRFMMHSALISSD